MIHVPHSRLVSPHAAPTVCHPEAILAKSKAICQTAPKDPYSLHGDRGDARNFRIVVRFFDDHDTEFLHDSSREPAEWENPAGKCRISAMQATESYRDATPA